MLHLKTGNSIDENGIVADNRKFHYRKNCDDKNGISLKCYKNWEKISVFNGRFFFFDSIPYFLE